MTRRFLALPAMASFLVFGCDSSTTGTTDDSLWIHYAYPSASYSLNSLITSNDIVSLTDTLGEPVYPDGFTISPDLNSQTGLDFDASTGSISGIPTKVHAATDYTVTAHSASGNGYTVLNIEVTEEPETPDNTDLLVAHSWKMSAATSASSIKIGSTTTTNVYSALQTCAKDNTLKFSSNGTVKETANTKCGSEPSSSTSDWHFNSGQTRLTIEFDGGTITYDILTLSSSTLKMSTDDVDYGDNKTHTVTFTFKEP